ncbi:hypothetical protein GFY24_09275 [Nocardia sp. SYP-A9097]|uniref:hypothetical protein n=1 Tax=Nocardia sp. SYP-A9097 TaxID=2663237 RepID=UPI00129B7012|nr:hypothetical protein [Nocardia sp. SYP-A9097]MRH87639.1 hypothetical protein [Nocardia sp. SYP-A9097]
MGAVDGDVCLSFFHVQWSSVDGAFIARSDQYPGLVARDEWSSLAAVDGLIDLIEQQRWQRHSSGRPAA